MLAEVGEKIMKAARLVWVVVAAGLYRCIQGRVSGIGQMQLVVPKGKQALSRMAGHGQPKRMGILQKLFLLLTRKVSEGG